MMMKVTENTTKGVYHKGCTKRLSSAFAVPMISAVRNDKNRGERFLVSSTDIPLKVSENSKGKSEKQKPEYRQGSLCIRTP